MLMMPLKHHLNQGLLVAVGCWLALTTHAYSQNNPPPILPQDQLPAGFVELTDKEVVLSYSVLIFGLIILMLQVYLLRVIRANAQHVLLTFTLTTIIIGGLYLVTIGLSSEQIAPAFSLYGAIVGYLLGRESGRNESVNIAARAKSERDQDTGS